MFQPDAPLGQVVQRAHAARERIGQFVGQRAGDAEATDVRSPSPSAGSPSAGRSPAPARHAPARCGRSLYRCRKSPARRPGTARRTCRAPGASEVRPVFQRVVAVGAIVRMRPQPRRLMPDAVHVERVEADLPGHQWVLRSGNCMATTSAPSVPATAWNGGSSGRRRRRTVPAKPVVVVQAAGGHYPVLPASAGGIGAGDRLIRRDMVAPGGHAVGVRT